jgi:nuclear migration protein JNM1
MRIARLRREVEECRIAAEKSAGEEQGATGGSEGVEADAKALNQLLARIDAPSVRGGGLLNRRALQPAGVDGTAGKSDNDKAGLDVPSSQPAAAEESLTEEQSLSRIAAFDTRLASLEAALGLSALDSTGAVAGYASGSGPVPILPALTLLDSQFATLSSASSLASLEAASAKIAALKHEARNLAALQQAQTVPVSGGGGGRTGLTATNHSGEDSAAASEYGDAEEAPSQHDIDGNEADTNGTSDAQPHLHASDLTTLRALYTHLPTLQALMPTLPALLTRLRSLRALHTTAGQAAADLEALERRQDQLDAELATWRAGLERVEAAVREADQANGRNGTVVKGWVEGLEKRVEALTDGAKTG